MRIRIQGFKRQKMYYVTGEKEHHIFSSQIAEKMYPLASMKDVQRPLEKPQSLKR